MSAWFTNRGQAIQVAVSAGSLVLATVVAVQQNIIPAFWALIAIPIGSLAIWRLSRSAPAPNTDVPTIVADAKPPEAKPSDEQARAIWAFETIRLPVGQRWRRQNGLIERYEVRLLDIGKNKDGTPTATFEARWDLGTFRVSGVEKGDADSVFVLPETRFFDGKEALVAFIGGTDIVRAFAIRVDHVDSHARIVDFEVTTITGYRHLIPSS